MYLMMMFSSFGSTFLPFRSVYKPRDFVSLVKKFVSPIIQLQVYGSEERESYLIRSYLHVLDLLQEFSIYVA